MIIRTINKRNLSRIRNEFEEVLLDNQIRYTRYGIAERDEDIVFFFTDHKDAIHLIEFKPHECIGRDIHEFAKETMAPVFKHMKSAYN